MRRVVYLLSGPAHLMNLAVSVCTLRKHWSGNVTVFAWPESYEIACQIAEAFDADCTRREPAYRGRMDQPLDRILLPRSMPGDAVVYLDADTTVHGPLERLFASVETCGYAATQFTGWWTNRWPIKGRLEDLRGVEGIPEELIDQLVGLQWPSLNCGVFGATADTPVLDTWYAWTWAARAKFIADEKTQHLLQAYYPPDRFEVVLHNGAYNCSPKYQPYSLLDEDVVIYHYHGDCNTRPNKCRRAVELWYPLYRDLLARNVANMQEWRPAVRNKWLDRLDAAG